MKNTASQHSFLEEARETSPRMSRVFAMPSGNTFSMPPVKEFVDRYMAGSKRSIDPFARNSRLATITNDLDPCSATDYHHDAEAFLREQSGPFDMALFDPPYSPRQISELYRGIGLPADGETTQNARLYKRVRDALDPLIAHGGIVLSFGWNSAGMGKGRGYELLEVLLVNHGGAHNDTICLAKKKLP